ncbi:MAG TPA: M18 family aminopeptidase, partial [Gammaproteobacteria bacterium]|nr:M18 family aminopeptidase [Gammaproteobacteria bacterium]
MQNKLYISRLLTFLNTSPTPFHAVANMAIILREAGYKALDERDHWQLQTRGHYYVIRNDSSIIAFIHPDGQVESGLRLLGTHTDSPCLRLKPQAIRQTESCILAAVEVYGGALLNPWFDRDLSIAGRVSWSTSGKIHSQLVDFKKPVACVPSLAIHLNRKANQEHRIDTENDLRLLLQLQPDAANTMDPVRLALQDLLTELPDATACDYELSCY